MTTSAVMKKRLRFSLKRARINRGGVGNLGKGFKRIHTFTAILKIDPLLKFSTYLPISKVEVIFMVVKCTCGARISGSLAHSDWCDLMRGWRGKIIELFGYRDEYPLEPCADFTDILRYGRDEAALIRIRSRGNGRVLRLDDVDVAFQSIEIQIGGERYDIWFL